MQDSDAMAADCERHEANLRARVAAAEHALRVAVEHARDVQARLDEAQAFVRRVAKMGATVIQPTRLELDAIALVKWWDSSEPASVESPGVAGQVLIVDAYPCHMCGVTRTREEGGTVFTVCDECWDALDHCRRAALIEPVPAGNAGAGADRIAQVRQSIHGGPIDMADYPEPTTHEYIPCGDDECNCCGHEIAGEMCGRGQDEAVHKAPAPERDPCAACQGRGGFTSHGNPEPEWRALGPDHACGRCDGTGVAK